MEPSANWTSSHDLALIFFALAYGTDHDLDETELQTLTQTLRKWALGPDEVPVREIVMEAAAAFLEGEAEDEVRKAIRRLADDFSFEQRQQALRDMIRVAEADGVLLAREQGLIHFLAEAWSLKQMGEDLISDTSAVVQREGEEWGLVHELAFVYILVAHGTTEDLSSPQIDVALARLQEWRPDLSEERVREVFRRALQVYADEPARALIQESVVALKSALPLAQRLAILDDLYTVARADGGLTEDERTLVREFARAWDVNVRLNGQH